MTKPTKFNHKSEKFMQIFQQIFFADIEILIISESIGVYQRMN